MTVEHLRPLLDSPGDHHLLHTLAEGLAQGAVPESIVDAVRLGRMTALSKPDGGVRGIVVGDVIRRLVSENGPADERCSGISNCFFSVRPVNPRRV